MKHEKSRELFERARKLLPGGVNSPVRAFGSVGGLPPFIREAHGAFLRDEDGNEYLDYVGSWGPMILGYSHPEVLEILKATLPLGTSFGAPTRLEVEIAEFLTERLDHLEMLRMVNSGTEATMSALRLARGATGRDRIVKCGGCYHGHGDALLVQAGSGALTFGTPSSPGVPESLARDTLVIPYNDASALEAVAAENPKQIAAFILEPVPGNMGVILPEPGYLEAVREICTREGIVLIFDEVMTGFRLTFGGVTGMSGVRPDLVTYGKIIGGGLPVGAYGGRAELMKQISPSGPVYQAGTLSGNPLAMAAGLETLKILWRERESLYPRLETLTLRLMEGLSEAAAEAGIPACSNRTGSMFTGFFTEGPVKDFDGATRSDTDRFAKYNGGMLEQGVYLAPSQYEAGFVSAAHTEADIRRTVEAARTIMKTL